MSASDSGSTSELQPNVEERGGSLELPPVPPGVVDKLLARVRTQLEAQPLPEATYRVQFNQNFTFQDAAKIIPYLHQLGITHLYASPYMKARAGSLHGYDIVDHGKLNPEVGSEQDYIAFQNALAANGMGHILDVVPNHMGVASDENAWWMDVLENGPSSTYANYFDIDWKPLKPDLVNKVLLPVLGDQYGKVLEDQQLQLHFHAGAFVVQCYGRNYPIAPRSTAQILEYRLEELEHRLGADDHQYQEYQSILTAIRHLPDRTETDEERIEERRREKEVIKRRLFDLCQNSPAISRFLEENVTDFNGTRGEPRSFDLMDNLLKDQAYRLAYWRVASDEINYRRFFDINDLGAISMEREEVFEAAHALIARLLAQGNLQGLRIDHADGLYDPVEYLRRLQRMRFLQQCLQAARVLAPTLTPELSADDIPPPDQIAVAPEEPLPEPSDLWQAIEAELLRRFDEIADVNPHDRLAQPLYVVVEKILEHGERLPENWPVAGTTGYEFLNALNGLFVETGNVKAFDRNYTTFVHERLNLRSLIFASKKLIVQTSMSGEVSVLGHQLDRISEHSRWTRDFTLNSLTTAIREVIAGFPVYRTYIDVDGNSVSDQDRRWIDIAVARAKAKNPAINASLFDFVRDILNLRFIQGEDSAAHAEQRKFIGRFQQTTGPVMAKGVEDTASYIYNRLVALNEVGGDPEKFGWTLEEFHRHNLDRHAQRPHAILSTSTHDTKRSEDVRCRIDVLSEIPQFWKSRLSQWTRWNQKRKVDLDGESAPSRNDEYLLYQTLIGCWPFEPIDGPHLEEFQARMRDYMLKAVREAKVHTSWISPNEEYERALQNFVTQILTPSKRNQFLDDIEDFAAFVAHFGAWNSLSQTLIKLTSPGVPDVYQGTELWNFSLVDPDNRRPVDYARRIAALESFAAIDNADAAAATSALADMLENWQDGRIKLYTLSRLLRFRQTQPNLFTIGNYHPVKATGDRAEHVVAFARQDMGTTVVAVAPRLCVSLSASQSLPPLGDELWHDTALLRRPEIRATRYRNLFTGEVLNWSAESGGKLPLKEILKTFPVALLVAEE